MTFRIIWVAPLAWMAAMPWSAQAGEIDQVATHLRATNSMTADFAQTDRNGKSVAGTLYLKRPGKIRFQYGSGSPLLIVGDGKALNFIDYSVKQVSRWPIGNSPLGFLVDPSKDIAAIAHVIADRDPRLVIVEVRDPRRPEFGSLTLSFTKQDSAPGGLEFSGWVAQDAQNNRTAVRLSNQRYNVPVRDQQFTWRDPRPTTPKR